MQRQIVFRTLLVCAGLALAATVFAQQPRAPRVSALRIDEPVRLDGRLDEPFWSAAEVGGEFVQREPVAGAPATEATEVRVAFDGDTLYIAVVARDSDPDSIVAREMARDGSGGGGGPFGGVGALRNDDQLAIVLDTFDDGRNAFFFETNPLGARADGLIEDENGPSFEWDGVWRVATARTAEGWVAEFAIPFSTLRFDPESDVWGLNVQRLIRSKNEETLWAPVGLDADVTRVSLAGELAGLSGLSRSLNLRVKPYVAASDARDFANPALQPDDGIDAGVDLLRWGITGNVTLDLTANTDFAQVEADEQRVNLTRFSLFFPEKREFFLESAGIFDFGPGSDGRGGPSVQMFFSRRIGLQEGEIVPIRAGARLTGRTDDWSFGLLDVQTGSHDPLDPELDPIRSTNWGVARIKRNIGDRSTIGAIFTNRQPAGGGWNRVFGLDADINPSRKWNFNGFLVRSDDEMLGGGWAGGGGFAYSGTIWDANASYQELPDSFEPGLGFLPRKGVRRLSYSVTAEPRPEGGLGLGFRNLSFNSRTSFIYSTEGELQSVDSSLRFFGFETQAGDRATFFGGYNFERLEEPFEIADGVVIPAGEYDWRQIGIFVDTDGSRPVALFGFWEYGGFYGGTRLMGRTGVNLRLNRYLATETSWNHNKVDLPYGAFVTNVLQQRLRVALSPNLFWNTFVQLNDTADVIAVNSRFNWIYKPGMDIFLVYNQDWDTSANNRPVNRAVILKFTYLFTL